MNKRIMILTVALTILMLGSVLAVKPAQAFWPFDLFKGDGRGQGEQTQNRFPALIQKIIDKFNLNEDEVDEVVAEYRNERELEMQNRFEENLQEAVKAGKLTEEQKTAIEAKHEEMQEKMEGWVNLSPEERRQKSEEHRDEMKTWAEENGIDYEQMGIFGLGFRRGFKAGFRMGNN